MHFWLQTFHLLQNKRSLKTQLFIAFKPSALDTLSGRRPAGVSQRSPVLRHTALRWPVFDSCCQRYFPEKNTNWRYDYIISVSEKQITEFSTPHGSNNNAAKLLTLRLSRVYLCTILSLYWHEYQRHTKKRWPLKNKGLALSWRLFIFPVKRVYLCRKFRALILETKNPQMKIFRNTMNYPEILRKTD